MQQSYRAIERERERETLSLFLVMFVCTMASFLSFPPLFLSLYFVSCFVSIAECSTNATTRAGTAAVPVPVPVPVHHLLSLDFYSKTCPQLDNLVSSVTSLRFKSTPVSAPATIRLFFHDCFVEGCDASILLSPGSEGSALVERNMPENSNLNPEGFNTVDMAKKAVEDKCPGVVSCADILAIATREFIHLAGGPYYPVKKGRKDSRASKASKVKLNLPRSNSSLDELLRLFATKGLNRDDLVALSGAHSIGFSHCDQFVSRLYDFNGSKQPDPFIDGRLLKALQMSCPPFGGNTDIVVPFDVQTPFLFDPAYYGNLEAKMGLLASDQALFLDPRTRPLVQDLGKDKARFFAAFSSAMDKMGSIGVKKGKRGEIRRQCSKHLS